MGSIGLLSRQGEAAIAKRIEAGIDHRVEIAMLALRYGMPALYTNRAFAEAGGLISYGSDFTDSFRQVGIYCGRILKGEKPADLPVQLATRFEFVINLKTAK
jgi:putative ABC transport system substrate-binding protein